MDLKAPLLKSTKLGSLLRALPQLARRDGSRAHLPSCWEMPLRPWGARPPPVLEDSTGACGQTHTSFLLSPRPRERTTSTLQYRIPPSRPFHSTGNGLLISGKSEGIFSSLPHLSQCRLCPCSLLLAQGNPILCLLFLALPYPTPQARKRALSQLGRHSLPRASWEEDKSIQKAVHFATKCCLLQTLEVASWNLNFLFSHWRPPHPRTHTCRLAWAREDVPSPASRARPWKQGSEHAGVFGLPRRPRCGGRWMRGGGRQPLQASHSKGQQRRPTAYVSADASRDDLRDRGSPSQQSRSGPLTRTGAQPPRCHFLTLTFHFPTPTLLEATSPPAFPPLWAPGGSPRSRWVPNPG